MSRVQGSQYKIVLLGDVSVGKTSILNRYVFSTFSAVYQASIGMDFLSKTVTVGHSAIKLRVWDTAGMEKFRSLIPAYIRDCSAAVIVYDITKKDTFQSIDKWTGELRNSGKGDTIIALAANKQDMTARRDVQEALGEEKARELNALYFPVSASTGDKIEEMFTAIAEKLVPLTQVQTPLVSDSIHLTPPSAVSQKRCRC